MREQIIRDVSDSMLDDIRSLSSKFEKENVGFASTMKKVRQLDGAAVKRTLAGVAANTLVGTGVLSMINAGVNAMNHESWAMDGGVLAASMALAATFGVLYDRMTDKERGNVPEAFKDFKNANLMEDSQLADLVKSKSPSEYQELSNIMKSYRSNPTYDGDSPVASTPKMKM